MVDSRFFLEAECPRKGHSLRPLRGGPLKIMQHLYNEFPSLQQPKQISKATGVSYEAVKKWLQRNQRPFRVVQEIRGWYRAWATLKLLRGIGLEPLKVHALQIQMSPNGGSPPQIKGQRDTMDFRGRKVTLQPSRGGVMASVRASVNPFSVGEFQDMVSFLEGLGYGCDLSVIGSDFGVDVKDHVLRIRGVESVSLQAWNKAYLKAYNKQVIQATRFEACFHRLDLDPGEVVSLLQGIGERPSQGVVPEGLPSDSWRDVS